MKIRILISFIIIFSIESFSQTKVGTTIGQFLKIEPSSRSAAMGNAGTSLFGEAASIFYNPASLGRLTQSDAQFTYSNWIADISYNFAAVALNIEGIGVLALQVTSLNSGDIKVRTVDQPLGTGELYSVSDIALGAGYGLMLTDRVSVGIVINYFQETIWHSSLSTFGLNFGVQYQVQTEGFTLGASLSNFGPRTGYSGRDLYVDYDFNSQVHGDNDQLPAELRTNEYSLPTTFRVGMSYPLKIGESNIITVAADALHPNDNDERINAGIEWKFFDYFALRGGYRDFLLTDSEGGLTLGAGVNVSIAENYNVRFDYSWADYGRLKDTHRFTLGVRF